MDIVMNVKKDAAAMNLRAGTGAADIATVQAVTASAGRAVATISCTPAVCWHKAIFASWRWH